MKPSSLRILSRLIFMREAGISTLSKRAPPALRIRVNMSAMGSVMLIFGLPTGFDHPRDLSLEGHGAETDAADAEPPQEGPGPAAQRTTVVILDPALGLPLPLGYQ